MGPVTAAGFAELARLREESFPSPSKGPPTPLMAAEMVVGERGNIDGSLGAYLVFLLLPPPTGMLRREPPWVGFAEVAKLREESLSTACHVLSDACQWETFLLLLLFFEWFFFN